MHWTAKGWSRPNRSREPGLAPAIPPAMRRWPGTLQESPKDNAENLMIVDLMRNDLSRVCEAGSVAVPHLCRLQSFSHVHHLVSTVTGHLCPSVTPIDVLRATFPGGSVTGAPKIRAMEIIRELEPSPRGAYCGAHGWIGFDGKADLAMTIRSLTLTPDLIVAQAGGGIVADSDPAAEYEESMVKAAPLLQAALSGFLGRLTNARLAFFVLAELYRKTGRPLLPTLLRGCQ